MHSVAMLHAHTPARTHAHTHIIYIYIFIFIFIFIFIYLFIYYLINAASMPNVRCSGQKHFLYFMRHCFNLINNLQIILIVTVLITLDQTSTFTWTYSVPDIVFVYFVL